MTVAAHLLTVRKSAISKIPKSGRALPAIRQQQKNARDFGSMRSL